MPAASFRGTYDALLNNGLVDRLGGPAFTSRLSAYYGQEMNSVFNEVKRYRMEVRGVIPIAVQEQIRKECIKISVDERFLEELSSDCDLALKEAEAKQILDDIVTHPNMRAYLRRGISRDSIAVYLLTSRQGVIESLVAELRSFRD